MSTQILFFSGTCKWANGLTKTNKFDRYTICMYLDDESKAKFEEHGLQLKIRTDDDGDNYVQFHRPHSKLVRNETRLLGMPEILKEDGSHYEEGEAPRIGNGSKVTCKVTCYDTQKGKGTQLEAVRIDVLEEYEGPEIDPTEASPF